MYRTVAVCLLLCALFCASLYGQEKRVKTMCAVSAGYVNRGQTMRYNSSTPWREGVAARGDIAFWDREETSAFGLSLLYQRFFQGEVPRFAYEKGGTSWTYSVGPSLFLRTPDGWLPGGIRLLCVPHAGFGIWVYSPFESSRTRSTSVGMLSLGLGAQFRIGGSTEWTVKYTPARSFSQGMSVDSYEISLGYDFYF